MIFVEADEPSSSLIGKLSELLKQVKKANGVGSTSYIQIMLKYFVANLMHRAGDMASAAELAQEIVDKDILNYFGHLHSEFSIEPMLIILNNKFDQFTSIEMGSESTEIDKENYARLFKEVKALAIETER